MTQYNIKQVMNRFGQSGVIAIKKEVHQLVKMDALNPDYPKELSIEDCRAAMAYMIFMK